MAKRFTDTEKWLDDWFVGLSPELKLFWVYLCDTCDHAGVWRVSPNAASRLLGVTVTLEDALAAFGKRVVPFKEGYWFIVKFVAFQYGLPLNRANKAHASVLRILQKQGFDPSPYEGDMEKDEVVPLKALDFNDPGFQAFWAIYPRKVCKGDAWAAWVKHKPDAEACIKTITWQKKSEDWTKEGGKWIPYPASWLNDKRWHDEDLNAHKRLVIAPRQKPEDDGPLAF